MPPYELFTLLAPSFVASVFFVAIHESFGFHVLKRGVIFVDLALAQMSALGSTVAFAAGHVPTSTSGLAYAFVFSALGAALLTASRALPKSIQAEAYIGILYVVTTAMTIIVVDRSPQGAEHVKQILVGSILSVSASDLPKLGVLYGAIGAFLWTFRRPLLASSESAVAGRPHGLLWDFAFYLCFGMVVTSSVAIAGVLLVFCFLIIPAIIGSLFTQRASKSLGIGLLGGAIASGGGLAASLFWDLPAGAAMVVAFALTLLAAGVLSAFVRADAEKRRKRLRLLVKAVSASILGIVLVAMLWLILAPRADQPVLALLERASGIGPESFLTTNEQAVYAAASDSARIRQAQGTQLTLRERQARWKGEELSDEAVRSIGTFQQALSEMSRGEEFVLQSLLGRARERERWYVGPALLLISLAGLLRALPATCKALSNRAR